MTKREIAEAIDQIRWRAEPAKVPALLMELSRKLMEEAMLEDSARAIFVGNPKQGGGG